MAISKAGTNSQSGQRLSKMLRVTATGTLSLTQDSIIDGSGLTITIPSGEFDGQQVKLTWVYGSDFTLSGLFTTSQGDTTDILVAAEDSVVSPLTFVWDSLISKWRL